MRHHRRHHRCIERRTSTRCQLHREIDIAKHVGDIGRCALHAIACLAVGAALQQHARRFEGGVHRAGVQRGDAVFVGVIEVRTRIQYRRHQCAEVRAIAIGTGLGVYAEQNQQGRRTRAIRRVRRRRILQQRVQQATATQAVATVEAEARGGVQRGLAARVDEAGLCAELAQRGDHVGVAQRRGDHQRGHVVRMAQVDRYARCDQCARDVGLARADGGRQRRSTRIHRELRVGVRGQQPLHALQSARAARAQQRGGAAVVAGVHGQTQFQQACDGVWIGRCSGQVFVAQRTLGQRPAIPAQPVFEFGGIAGEREAERRFAAGGGTFRIGAMRDERFHQRQHFARFAIERDVQRRGARAIARVGVGAAREQCVQHRQQGRAAGVVQRRAAVGIGAEGVGTAFEQRERECRAFAVIQSREHLSEASRARGRGAGVEQLAHGSS